MRTLESKIDQGYLISTPHSIKFDHLLIIKCSSGRILIMNFNNEFLDRVGRILDCRKLVVVDYWYLTLYRKNEKHFKNEQKVGMLLQKRTDTRGVGISSMRKSIYLLTTTPSSHTHRFHPLPLATTASCSPHPLATPIHSTHSPQLSSILLTCAKFKVWMTIVESGWNVWVW